MEAICTIEKLKGEMQSLEALKTRMLATPDQQISLTNPCADSNEGKPPLKSAQDRLSCNR
jgi:hypothetical protein